MSYPWLMNSRLSFFILLLLFIDVIDDKRQSRKKLSFFILSLFIVYLAVVYRCHRHCYSLRNSYQSFDVFFFLSNTNNWWEKINQLVSLQYFIDDLADDLQRVPVLTIWGSRKFRSCQSETQMLECLFRIPGWKITRYPIGWVQVSKLLMSTAHYEEVVQLDILICLCMKTSSGSVDQQQVNRM